MENNILRTQLYNFFKYDAAETKNRKLTPNRFRSLIGGPRSHRLDQLVLLAGRTAENFESKPRTRETPNACQCV